MTTERIGFIGVGSMGLPIARHILAGGYQLGFSTRRQSAVELLEAAGGRSLPTPLVVAEQSDVVFTCLPSDRELFEVYLGPEGLIEYLREGGTIIDLSTTSPMIMQRIAAEAQPRGIRVIDAPVSGGVYGAERGTLTIMAGCDAAVLEEVRPLLSTFGERIFHVGGIGMAKVFKIVNNLLTGTAMVLVGEALSLAANAGADLELLHEVISASSGNSPVWASAVPKLLYGDEGAPGFRLELMRKDIQLATSLGSDLNTPLPLTNLALQFYVSACARGMGKQDAYDVAKLVARFAQAHLSIDASHDDTDQGAEEDAGL